jgi:hypothetical protein
MPKYADFVTMNFLQKHCLWEGDLRVISSDVMKFKLRFHSMKGCHPSKSGPFLIVDELTRK